ncbi:TIR domain-containing protein [Promicromonospora sp. NPDC059942]|uniref:TIR domain-containing protein n=1 Tax=Promicromonospora sp. NPDC059942 TaxID=3347009 RepID=UPI00366944DE
MWHRVRFRPARGSSADRGQDTPHSSTYDAFISYSHKDIGVARELHRQLESFAWVQRERSLRIYRDEANLAAGGALDATIQAALENSEWLILIASPDAATSEYVALELRWWWAKHQSWDRLLIGVARGQVAWTPEAADLVAERGQELALPGFLLETTSTEPKYENLHLLTQTERPRRTHGPELSRLLASFAGPIRGVEKDLLVNYRMEWLQAENRRGARIRAALVAAVVVVTVAAGVAFDQWQRSEARNTVANARSFANAALELSATDDDLAKLLAVEAYRLDPATRSALYQATSANPLRRAEVTIPSEVTTNDVGRTLLTAAPHSVVGVAGDRVFRWSVPKEHLTDLGPIGQGPAADDGNAPTDIATSKDGTVVAVSTKDRTVLWVDGHRTSTRFPGAQAVGLSPDGSSLTTATRLAYFWEDDPAWRIQSFSTDGGESLVRKKLPWTSSVDKIAMDDDVITLAGMEGNWHRLRRNDLSVLASSEQGLAPMNGAELALSPNARYYGHAWFDLSVYPNFTGARTEPGDGFHYTEPVRMTIENDLNPGALPGAHVNNPIRSSADRTTVFAISDSGTRYLVAGGDETWVTSLDEPYDEPNAWKLTGAGQPDAAIFLSDHEVVTADQSELTFWDISPPKPALREDLDLVAPDGGTAGFSAMLAVSPDERSMAVAGAGQLMVRRADGAQQQGQTELRPIWLPNRELLLVSVDQGWILNPDDTVEKVWSRPSPPQKLNGDDTLGAWIDGSSVIVVGADREIAIRDWATGRLVREIEPEIPATPESEFPGLPTGPSLASLSPDGQSMALVADDASGAYVVDMRSGGTGPRLPVEGPSGVLHLGEEIAVVHGDGIDVVDGRALKVASSITMHGDYGMAVATIPGTDAIARVKFTGTVELFDMSTGASLGEYPLERRNASIANVQWETASLLTTQDSIYSVAANTAVSRWSLKPEDVVRAACRAAGRQPSPAEWSSVASIEAPDDLSCDRPR